MYILESTSNSSMDLGYFVQVKPPTNFFNGDNIVMLNAALTPSNQ